MIDRVRKNRPLLKLLVWISQCSRSVFILRPRAYDCVWLVIWWKLSILLFEKGKSQGEFVSVCLAALLQIHPLVLELCYSKILSCNEIPACVLLFYFYAYCWLALVFRQEHLHVLSDDWLEDRPKPLSVKDQAAISRLEEQAEEFLHAVLCRKGEPWFHGIKPSTASLSSALWR